jgi:putative SOS response-associated peptidase YedK
VEENMCSHYQAVKEREKLLRQFGVEPPAESAKIDLWAGYLGTFIRKHPHADAGDEAVPAREALNGLFGLVPHWATDTRITKSTYNCRSETAAEKPSFRDAYKRNQRCIIPADAIYEPDWRTGKAIATRIEHVSGEALGIAGLWSSWKNPKNGWVHSFTMLTINADAHPLMKQFHQPTDEKRMVVILPPQHYAAWLDGESAVVEYMVPLDAEQLQAVVPAPSPPVPNPPATQASLL